jgi:hypothetical protein
MYLFQQKDFRVVDCDVVETIGRPCGTGGIYRIQHGQKIVTGSRGMLEYLDAITGQENCKCSMSLGHMFFICWFTGPPTWNSGISEKN